MLGRLLATLLLALLALPAQAAEPPLVIGVTEFAPHVMRSEEGLEGFDIDIWNKVAAEMGRESTFRVMPFERLLRTVSRKELDAALAGITITYARELNMDFSVAYMDTGLRILIATEQDSPIVRLFRSVGKSGVWMSALYLLGFIVLCAHVLYFAERGRPAVNDSYFPGIFEAAWCVLATITTVGYGDIAPSKWLGRFVSFLVMLIGISFFGVAVAELSSGLMMEELRSEINGPDDLRGHDVATLAGSTSADVLRRYGSRLHEVQYIEEAYALLQAGEVDAVLFDAAPLMHFARQDGNRTVRIVGPLIEHQSYGIAFPSGSPLREAVNRALLKIIDDGSYDEIYAKWFGVTE